MKSTPEMRRYNLCILIDEAGGRTAFADKDQARELKIEYGYIGQLVNNNRGIGNSVARKLELIGNKPKNWLDHPHYKKWLDQKLITEHDLPSNEVLKDISFLLQIREPVEDYEDNNLKERNLNLEKISTSHNNEIEQLIEKIEFISSQEDGDEDIELIKKIVDMVYNKNK